MRENSEKVDKAWAREKRGEQRKTAAHILSCERANASCSIKTLVFKTQLHLMVSFKPWLTSHSSPSSFSLWKSGAADLTDTQHKRNINNTTTKPKNAGWLGERCARQQQYAFFSLSEVYACVHVGTLSKVKLYYLEFEVYWMGLSGGEPASIFLLVALHLFGLTMELFTKSGNVLCH